MMFIARDEDGRLFLYRKKPERMHTAKGDKWYGGGGCMEIEKGLFPEVAFRDGPKEVFLTINKVVHSQKSDGDK